MTDRYGEASTTSCTRPPHAAQSLAECFGPGRIDVHIHRAHVVGQRLRVAQRLDDSALNAANGNQNGVVHARQRFVATQRQLRCDVIVVLPRHLEDHDDHGDQ